MIYRWLVRKQAAAGWERLSQQRIDETPLAADMHFARVVWGKVVEEVILPDTRALSAALEEMDAEAPGSDH
jgi:hypothetical protein